MNVDAAFAQPIVFILGFLALVLSIGVHEFSHVWSAYLQGDQTGRLMGRLTLNPIKHLDPIGTIFMVASMIFGVGIGWGKPAPFNPNNLRYRRWGPFLVAVAGPISNIVLVALFGYAWVLFSNMLPETNMLMIFLQTLVIINASLAAFNLLPIPPLDGSRFISAVLGDYHPVTRFLERWGFWLILALLFVVPGFLSVWIHGGVTLILTILGLG